MIIRTDVRKAKTSIREVSGPGAREAGRDWRFFWSSRTTNMRLYLAQYKLRWTRASRGRKEVRQ